MLFRSKNITTGLAVFLLLACPVFSVLAWGQNYDADNKDMEVLETRAGGNQFYVDTSKIKNSGGRLSFDVVGYSSEQKKEGGYSSGSNSLDCKDGTYNRSPEKNVGADGKQTSGNDGEAPASSMSMRNDGGALYGKLKELCKDYGELEEDEIQW